MWIAEDELLHAESCPSKVLLIEVQITQLLPGLQVTHKPVTKPGPVGRTSLQFSVSL